MSNNRLSRNSFIKDTFLVSAKELWSLFSSPIAVLFVGTFLLASLFSFFWLEKFFASNIASMRGLFIWMPALLIPLCSAITMKMWSEEKHSGNLQFLLTLPSSEWSLVFGKFLACITLGAISILLTLPLAVFVYLYFGTEISSLVVSYAASIFLASFYIAIGLFVSSKTENQIVSFLISLILCSIFYIIGTQAFTSLFNVFGVEFLEKISSSGRFESVLRGVLDFSDIYYFASLTAVFLLINVLSLKKQRWPESKGKLDVSLFFILLSFNILASNFLVEKLNFRADLTHDKIYSLSEATQNYVDLLSEPLYIYGYFSSKTHPLLSPVVPRLKDMLKEYEAISDGRVKVHILDPREDQDEEERANTRFGVKPIPFQLSDKYQASIINSYFNIVISYGDQFEVLGINELLDVMQTGTGGVEVELKNPEYNITRAIKKTVYSFKNIDNLFSNLSDNITLTAYVSSSSTLPEGLKEFSSFLDDIASEFKQIAGQKLIYNKVDPGSPNSELAKKLLEDYGFRPMTTSLLSDDKFYFYMLLESGDKRFQLPLPSELKKEVLKNSLQQAFKRFSSSFTKTVGLLTPSPQMSNPYMRPQMQYQIIRQAIGQNHNLVELDLSQGKVDDSVDIAIVLEPSELSEMQVYALDQYLMKGGTLIVATSPFNISQSQDSLKVADQNSGLENWLKHYGVNIREEFVLDIKNTPFPIPVVKDMGSFKVSQLELVPYPFFTKVSKEDESQLAAVWGGLSELNVAWSSPIEFDKKDNDLSFTPVVTSSKTSWLSTDKDLQPDFARYPDVGFPKGNSFAPHVLAASIEGEFTSYFKDRDISFLNPADNKSGDVQGKKQETNEEKIISTIESSTDASKLLIISSNEFLADTTLQLMAASGNPTYENSLTFVQNLIDWALDDPALASIRGRSLKQKTLPNISRGKQQIFEYINYIIALSGICLLILGSRFLWSKKRNYYQELSK